MATTIIPTAKVTPTPQNKQGIDPTYERKTIAMEEGEVNFI
jgi:hypothetical protein